MKGFSKKEIERLESLIKGDIEKCLLCGKKMIPDKKSTIFGTKKWDGHTFKFQCKCHPPNWRISVG